MVLAGLAALSLGCAAEDQGSAQSDAEPHIASTLRLFFPSVITRGYGCGDCILVEHTDQNGAKLFGLIDTGRSLPTQDGTSTATLDYLTAHGVTELEFLVVTHQHIDHMGDAAGILGTIPTRTLYMKQYDRVFSHGVTQNLYEDIVRVGLEHGTRIVGIDPRSLDPHAFGSAFCPSMNESFRDWLAAHNDLAALCEPFGESNRRFGLGTARFALINWESWDTDGGLWDMSGRTEHERVNDENNNSLGLVVRLGETSAFLAGDMNNADEQGPLGVGDEDRLARGVGLVDFFKLNHHGYTGSNTAALLMSLLPKHVQITNDLGIVNGQTKSWLDDHGVEYAFTTSDPKGTTVTLDGTNVTMGYETCGRFARLGSEPVYVPWEEGRENLPVVFEQCEAVASSWEDLAALIRENAHAWEIDEHKSCVYAESLHIDVSALAECEATSCITVGAGQRISLSTTQDATARRSPSLTAEPLFLVRGELTIEGPLTLDGNKDAVGTCTASLIVNECGRLVLDGTTLSNNVKSRPSEPTGLNKTSCYGGAVLSLAGETVLLHGTALTHNACILDGDFHVEEQSLSWISGGGALASIGGTLTIDDAVIAQNESITRGTLVLDYYPGFVTTQYLCARGGGLYVANGASCTCTRLTLRENVATDQSYVANDDGSIVADARVRGCGCCINNAFVEMSQSCVQRNRTGEGMEATYSRGAGISIKTGTLRLGSTKLTENVGVAGGGALFVSESTAELDSCTVAYNASALMGGGVMVANKERSRITIKRCQLEANWAQGSHGGALWSEAPTLIEESVFANNSAADQGGAINSSGGISIDGRTTFWENKAALGNDVSVGNEAVGFYAIGASADCTFGASALSGPLDTGPRLSAFVLPSRAHGSISVINMSATSQTGIAQLRVNGMPYTKDRYVVTQSGSYLIEVVDLAGRTASQEFEINL